LTEREEISTLSRAEIIDVIATIAVYKFANLSREEVEAMLGLSAQTKVYQEAKAEGRAEGRLEMLAATVPLLLKTGMTIEQIAEQLKVDVAAVQQAAQRSQEQGE